MIRLALASAILLAVAGCSGTGGEPAPSTDSQFSTTAKGLEYKVYETKNLPKVSLALPPLDEGRIEVTGPAKWKVLSRSSSYLVGFYRITADSPPLIQMTVDSEKWTDTAVKTATLDNLDDFVAAMEKLVASELAEGAELQETIVPLILGDRPWARYVRGARFKVKGNLTAGDRQFLRTVVDGRIYTIELQVFKGKILDYRDDAYAVAANMKFTPGGEAAPNPLPMPSEEPMGEPMPEEKKPEEGN